MIHSSYAKRRDRSLSIISIQRRTGINKQRKTKKEPIIKGKIHIHPKGFAFVTPTTKTSFTQDIFIPKHLKGNAVDGDLVAVIVNLEKQSSKGPEGKVSEILERGKSEVVGIVWIINPKGNYVLYLHSFGQTKSALLKKEKEHKFSIGDRLVVEITDWGTENEAAKCKLIEKLGSIDDAQTDIPAAVKDFNIREQFPKNVIKEAKSFSETVSKKDLKDREDFTSLESFTIDPETARDFDDALSLSKDQKGHYHLGVHIADVSHYVSEGSALDKEARARGNSTYFPNMCIPMLPEILSNQLCSLKEKVIRLTASVLIELDPDGKVLNYKIARSYIKSRKRFTYEEAKRVLDLKEKSPYLSHLQLMVELCNLLKDKRRERGSIDFALPEISILIDKKGDPYDYKIVEYDITHQLVEEFMLKANEIVAEHFSKDDLPSLFRIHETPSQETLDVFYALARSLGFSLPANPTPADIQKLFALAKGSPHGHHLSVAFIRSMKLAIYSHENVGHYGLSLENYCHFTSPIRRYSDLVIHRLLFAKESGVDLEEISKECSEKERISFKAESSVVKLKKLRLYKHYYEKDPKKRYDAIITKVKPFGFFFEVEPLRIEGFLHVADLRDDYYEFLG
ncbi:MAG: VacB/RNase II family 3'-5' exoribonuclease, partial [Simkania negevensis]|nr:VacB/RNase II family 3'-5' exoribonuclease [Simkania negevensis]